MEPLSGEDLGMAMAGRAKAAWDASGTAVEIMQAVQGQVYHRRDMSWNMRSYCLDLRSLRTDMLNNVKEEFRDQHQIYTGRIDTLLLVHTLLLTFAFATLQYSDPFLPSSEHSAYLENLHPGVVYFWVLLVAIILVLPFWSIVMLFQARNQLELWLEDYKAELTIEQRHSLQAFTRNLKGEPDTEAAEEEVHRVANRVAELQGQLTEVWRRDCQQLIENADRFFWFSCLAAVTITAGSFAGFLRNHLSVEEVLNDRESIHPYISVTFVSLWLGGLLGPLPFFYRWWSGRTLPGCGQVVQGVPAAQPLLGVAAGAAGAGGAAAAGWPVSDWRCCRRRRG